MSKMCFGAFLKQKKLLSLLYLHILKEKEKKIIVTWNFNPVMDIPWTENKMLTTNTLLNLFAQLQSQPPPPHAYMC